MRLLTENSGAAVRIWPYGYANTVASPRFNSCHENSKLLHLAYKKIRRYITGKLSSSKELWLISDKHLHRKIKAWPCSLLRNGTVNISYASMNGFFSLNYSLFKEYICIWYNILGTDCDNYVTTFSFQERKSGKMSKWLLYIFYTELHKQYCQYLDQQ